MEIPEREAPEREKRKEREALAFLVAPLMVPLFVGLSFPDSLIITVAAIVGYGGTLLFGLPLYLLLRKLNITAFVVAPVFGAVIGAATMWLVWHRFGFGRPPDPIGMGGFIGAAVGTVLWAIARPDLAHRGGGAEGAQ